jgi:SSS family solute:Na+ symporter
VDLRFLVILAYLLGTLVIGFLFRRKARSGNVEFFLAGRAIAPLLLFFTLAATNFSAFTIFGFSGAGYRIGYAFYPVMGFGTGFMAVSFLVIGCRIRRLSADRGYITPSDFVMDRYNSPVLKKLFAAVMVVFTLPYLALQAIASGRSLESLVGTPYLVGAALVTVFIVAYVAMGGMRSIVWTDFVQGLMMVGLTVVALVVIARGSGGFVEAHRDVFADFPDLFSRPGRGATMGYGIWIGYMVLWLFADPMLPQLFQRFMAARDETALKTAAILYPLITGSLFFVTVSIGVLGRASFPDLPAEASDTIYPLLLGRYAGPVLGTLLLTGAIAALMSTMDSQLLTLTSMITVDLFEADRRLEPERVVRVERLTVVALGVLALIIAFRPPRTILTFLERTTFNGLSVLAPTVVGGLYWKGATKHGAIASIVVGELVVLAGYFGLVRIPGVLPVIPILAVTTAVFWVVSRLSAVTAEETDIVASFRRPLFVVLFLVLFALGNDFWAWGRAPVLFAGLPLWVWYYFALAVLLAGSFAAFPVESPNGRTNAD